ncbi:uncharacterized protein ISCGN_003794 [Ixodes scapularis]
MFTALDVRGVQRGRCKHSECECPEFLRETDLNASQRKGFPFGWCLCCGHSLAINGRLQHFVWAWEAKKQITFQLEFESELRFQTDIEENERRLKKVLNPIGSKVGNLGATIVRRP